MYGVINKLTKQLIVRVIVTAVGKPIRKTAKNKIGQPFLESVGQLSESLLGNSRKNKSDSPHMETCRSCQRLTVRAPSVSCGKTPSLGRVNGCRYALGSLLDSLLLQLFVSLSCVSSVGRRSTCFETVEQLSQCVLSTLYNTHYVN